DGGPGLHRHWLTPAEIADGRLRERDAFEHCSAFSERRTANLSAGHGERWVGRSARYVQQYEESSREPHAKSFSRSGRRRKGLCFALFCARPPGALRAWIFLAALRLCARVFDSNS